MQSKIVWLLWITVILCIARTKSPVASINSEETPQDRLAAEIIAEGVEADGVGSKSDPKGQGLVVRAQEYLNSIPTPKIDSTLGETTSSGKTRSRKFSGVGGWLDYLVKLLNIVIDHTSGPLELWKGLSKESPLEELVKAVQLLEEAAALGNFEAQYLLGELNFGKFQHPKNFTLALHYYLMADQNQSNATAQQKIGFIYATGISNAGRDMAKALTYFTFAGINGDVTAEMILGYRYLYGISVVKNCEEASFYYRQVADKAMNDFFAGPIGGRSLPRTAERLSDQFGGVYEYNIEEEYMLDDLLEYFRYMSKKGDVHAHLVLGQIYEQGTLLEPKDLTSAAQHFLAVAETVFHRDGSTKLLTNELKTIDSRTLMAAAKAAAFLGKLYWRGEVDMLKDNSTARRWFLRAAENGIAEGFNGLGEMYMYGAFGESDLDKAEQHFAKAAEAGSQHAQANLGLLYFSKKEDSKALKWFTAASQQGNVMAAYYLAEMYSEGYGVSRSCPLAVSNYKTVAEKADWEYSPMEDAYKAYLRGDFETALLWYLVGAEMGYEVAQANFAWLIEKYPFTSTNEVKALAYWIRSGNQGNPEARVRSGDYYFYGQGGVEQDFEKAAHFYEAAAALDRSSLAMWNLGWMYENGVGVLKDFNLAQRWYSNALEANGDAVLPVYLSQLMLALKYLWAWLTFSTDGNPFRLPSLDSSHSRKTEEHSPDADDWNIGPGGANMRKWKRRPLGEEDGEAGEDEAIEEDSALDNVVILALSMLVGWMVYIRQFRMPAPPDQQQQQEAQQRRQDESEEEDG